MGVGMTYRAWKHLERRVARALGMTRTGQHGGADVSSPWAAIECKYRASVPAWLTDAVDQARRNAGVSQLPVVVLATHGQRLQDALVVVRFSDFVEHYGAPDDLAADVLEDATAAELAVLAPDALA